MSTQQVYEVKKIVAHRLKNGQYTYRVRWTGYTEADDTWEPEEHLDGAERKLNTYWKGRREVQRANWFVKKYAQNAQAILGELDRIADKLEEKKSFTEQMELFRARKIYEFAIAKVTPAAPIGVQLREVARVQTGIRTQPTSPAEEQQEETPIPSPETEQVPEEPLFFEQDWTTYWEEFAEDPRITNAITGLPMEFIEEDDSQFVSFDLF